MRNIDNTPQSAGLLLDDSGISYNYPRKLKLRPDEENHRKLLGKLTDYARRSHTQMVEKHGIWEKLDDVLQVFFLRPDRANSRDKRKRTTDRNENDEEFQIVMPVSYANLEMLLTYMTSAFWHHPMFKYEGVGPEDTLGALLMQHVIDSQMRKNKGALALHTHWRDGFVYGFGAVAPYWKETWGYKTELKTEGMFSKARQLFLPTRTERRRSEYGLLYEGNALESIDPYAFLPDPKVPISEIQSGEFLGWTVHSSYHTLLTQERDDDDLFNVKFLHPKNNYPSAFTRMAGHNLTPTGEGMVDVLWMYVDLVPQEWDLGRGKYPEKWLFGVAGDMVIIEARPVGADHEMYQCAVCAPDYDGHSMLPMSRMEVSYDLQKLIDFMHTSHVANMRKAVNDMIIYDPWSLNSADMANPGAGKLIRTTRAMWGKGAVSQTYGQLQINDITRANIGDANVLKQFASEAVGTTDIARGEVQRTGARVSSAEATGARQLVLARFERTARIIFEQSHRDISEMCARNVQQRMSQETYIKVVGDLRARLMADFGYREEDIQQGRVTVDPYDMVVNYDIVAHDGQIPGSQDANTWIQLMQMAGQIPQMATQLKWDSLFKYIARLLRASNVDDFIERAPSPTVMPDDQIQQQVQQGNAIPANTPIA